MRYTKKKFLEKLRTSKTIYHQFLDFGTEETEIRRVKDVVFDKHNKLIYLVYSDAYGDYDRYDTDSIYKEYLLGFIFFKRKQFKYGDLVFMIDYDSENIIVEKVKSISTMSDKHKTLVINDTTFNYCFKYYDGAKYMFDLIFRK